MSALSLEILFNPVIYHIIKFQALATNLAAKLDNTCLHLICVKYLHFNSPNFMKFCNNYILFIADKFDFKIHYYEKDETWGQRIKWAARDFLDIDHIITNSTAHQFYFKPERENPFIDLCVGLALKFLVRWSDEIMPWKLEGAREFSEADFNQCNSIEADLLGAQRPRSSVTSLTNQTESLPEFLESHNLALFSDIAAKLSHVTEYIPPEPEVPRSKLTRRGSGSSYGESNHGSERYIKKEQKYRGSTKKDFKKAGSAIEIRNESDGDDFTSGFVEGCSSGPRSCPGSYVGIESLID